jgi:protoporphyrinogen oxidase
MIVGKKIAVLGAGPMGLVCAYELSKLNYQVDVFERETEIGGMSAHFDFSGINIEKYYHFVCGPDYYLFDLMKELNIYNHLKWTETKMGFYYKGKLYKWGGPVELLMFPNANIFEKIRYGLHVFSASKVKKWGKLDNFTALDWIKRWEGEKGYLKFWDSLFQLKFYEKKEKVAAPWLWSRLARVAKSRKNIFQEKMGYIEGGSLLLLEKLCNEIKKNKGSIFLNSPVNNVCFSKDNKIDIEVNKERYNYDIVVSTIPLQYLLEIVTLPFQDNDKLKALDNIGVVCVVVKMESSLTNNFWLNIADERFDIPGMIEVSNLNKKLKEHILYVPFYLHKNNPKYSDSDEIFKNKTLKYINLINPNLTRNQIKDIRIFRYEYAQPVATPHFIEQLPPLFLEERNRFYFADTAYSYPEDRSINESIRIAQRLVNSIIEHDIQ